VLDGIALQKLHAGAVVNIPIFCPDYTSMCADVIFGREGWIGYLIAGVYRRDLADLDRPGGTRDKTGSLTPISRLKGLAVEERHGLGCMWLPTKQRPPRHGRCLGLPYTIAAASFFSRASQMRLRLRFYIFLYLRGWALHKRCSRVYRKPHPD
jgi:hypothetical protein